jgi:hypothetical protein
MTEFQFNVKKSPADIRDWKLKAIYPKVEFPPSLDYRVDMFPIRNQGNQGSCAAMSGAAMKEWQEMKDLGITEYMSPQFIYYNREGGEGMYMRDLMKILNKLGDCPESFHPYGSLQKPTKDAYIIATNYIIKGYASVESIDELKTALYLHGPCILAVPVYNMTERMWKQQQGETFLGGHALCIVGYNEEGFIIRNSWGVDWGQNGYCIFTYEDWGLQWEVWSTVDHESDPIPPKPKKVCFLVRWWRSIFNH